MNLWVYIEEGGSIMYVLLFLNIVGLALMAFKIYSLYICEKSTGVTAQGIADRINQSKNVIQRVKNAIGTTRSE